MRQVLSPNGMIADYQYDDRNRLERQVNFVDANANQSFDSGTDTLLSDFDYTLQADGRRTGVTEVNDLGQTTVIEWTYDDMGRLVRESYDSHNNTLDFIADYVFDLVGNRIEKLTDTDPTFSGNPTFDELIDYTFDANDRLVTETLDAPGTTDDRHTVYDYDRTQQTQKVVYQGLDSSGIKLEQTDSSYDLQGRLSQVEIDSNGDGTVESTISYEYDTDGVRVAKDENGQVLFYLADKENFTGYAQTIEERDGSGDLVKSYTIGLDVLSEYDAVAAVVHYLMTDGHGSVRGLTDALGAMVSGQRFGFDAYGNAVGFHPSAALTSLLYSGEFFDTAIQQQYLRARWYDASTGRFNRLDPFFGNLSDPQSLHKYLYVHGDPVQGIDPNGLFSLSVTLSSANIRATLFGTSGTAIGSSLTFAGFAVSTAQTLLMFKSIFDLVSGSPQVLKELRRIQNLINLGENVTGAGSAYDWAKLRALDNRHIKAVVTELLADLPTIMNRISIRFSRMIGKLIAGKKDTSLVLMLPTAPGTFDGMKPLVTLGTINALLGLKKFKVKLGTSKTGRGGSLFGIGIQLGKKEPQNIFRVDYHGKRNPLPTVSGPPDKRRNHGNAYLLGSANGIGPYLTQISSRPKFHYHIPFPNP